MTEELFRLRPPLSPARRRVREHPFLENLLRRAPVLVRASPPFEHRVLNRARIREGKWPWSILKCRISCDFIEAFRRLKRCLPAGQKDNAGDFLRDTRQK